MQRTTTISLPWWKLLLYVACGNTLIAIVLWLAEGHGRFAALLVLSQCVGLSICCACLVLERLAGDRWGHGVLFGLAILLGVPAGMLAGVLAAHLLGVAKVAEMFFGDWRATLHFVGLGVVFTLVFAWFFRSRERMHELEQARQAAELREITGQKATLAAQLRLLQAQIEPHFLFNTLANLHSLIGQDDATARSMLEKLNDYLRASLVHSRADRTSLDDECRLLEAYLGIQAQRMGGRLTWEVAVPEALRHLAFPPMLLQPLVENSIRHGLEPKLGPGFLRVAAHEENGQLALIVSDDGVGLAGKSHGAGVGLANVRERLATMFGSTARFELIETPPAGVTAQLWIPKNALVP